MKNNNAKKVRSFAREKRVHLWQVADYLRVSEATITRKMRHLSDSEARTFLEAITKISKGDTI